MIRRPPRLVVSVHDVAPATAAASRQWVEELDRRGIPASLLVVPGPWREPALADDPSFAAWLHTCVTRGHEICLHGWAHRAETAGSAGRKLIGQVVARGAGEFWTLDDEGAACRAHRGLDELARVGLTATGFTPPGWLVSRAAIHGLRQVGLHYVTTHRSVIDLRTMHKHRAIVICHRPNGTGERVGAALMSDGPKVLLRPGHTLRIALHPDDLARPGLREAALRGIDAALDAGAVALTYEMLLRDVEMVSGAQPMGAVVPSLRSLDEELIRVGWQCA
jgi:uncharacterized protein